jgi:hypothetical protein
MTGSTGTTATDTAANLAAPFLDLLPISGIALSVIDRRGTQSIIHASDDTAAHLVETQFDLGEGPLFASFWSAGAEILPDAAVQCGPRWPAFAEALAPLQAPSLFAFPLVIGAASVGVAMAYRSTPGTLDAPSIDRGMSLARAIAGPALDRARTFADAEKSRAENPPLEMRREIHQATGMILAQLGCTATEALLRLQAYAFANERTVRDVASDVVQRHLDFSLLPH